MLSIMMIIFDYCFYHIIRVNTDDVNPPLLAYISGIASAVVSMFFIVITLMIWFSIIPKDADFDDFEKYYRFTAFVILVIFSLRYGPKRYRKLLKRWGDKAKRTKNKFLVIPCQFVPIIVALITMWFRFN